MGFFYTDASDAKKPKRQSVKGVDRLPPEVIRKKSCAICPRKPTWNKLKHPKFETSVDRQAKRATTYYLLALQPSQEDDRIGNPLGSEAVLEYLGRTVEDLLFDDGFWAEDIAIGYAARCYSEEQPSELVLATCRKYWEDDIAQLQPDVVVGFGEAVLNLVTGRNDIRAWAGRRIPLKIADHECWFFPVLDVTEMLSLQRYDRNDEPFESDNDRWFIQQLTQALDDRLPNEIPYLGDYTLEQHLEDCDWVFGNSASDFRKIEKWLADFADCDVLTIDYETQNLRPYRRKSDALPSSLLTVALGAADKTVAFPLLHPESWQGLSKLQKKLMQLFGEFLQHSKLKVAHNLEMEQEWSLYYWPDDFAASGLWDDTMALAYLLDERRGGGVLSLDALVYQHFAVNLKQYFQHLDKARMSEMLLADVLPYNALDSKYTLLLYDQLDATHALPKNQSLSWLRQHHSRLASTISYMHAEGVLVDQAKVKSIAKDLAQQVEGLKTAFFDLEEVQAFKKRTSRTFNPDSDDDVFYVLGEILQRDEIFVDRGKGKSADAAVLRSIPANISKLPELLLEYREVTKLQSTYITPIDGYIAEDGRIHASFNSKLTGTGRLSCSDPNLQNFPSRKNKFVRSMIIAPPDHVMMCADYGQIEARAIAMLTEDQAFCEALWNGDDVHMDWALRIREVAGYAFDLHAERAGITNEEEAIQAFRSKIKNSWVFPLFFGCSLQTAARYTGADADDVMDVFNEFWDTFAGVKKWQRRLADYYREHLYVETLTGRRRRFSKSALALGYNDLINAPVQGTASDLVTDAMNRVSEEGYRVVKNIHDDLVSYVKQARLKRTAKSLAKLMCATEFDWVNVPLSVEITAGPNWYEQHEVLTYESK